MYHLEDLEDYRGPLDRYLTRKGLGAHKGTLYLSADKGELFAKIDETDNITDICALEITTYIHHNEKYANIHFIDSENKEFILEVEKEVKDKFGVTVCRYWTPGLVNEKGLEGYEVSDIGYVKVYKS